MDSANASMIASSAAEASPMMRDIELKSARESSSNSIGGGMGADVRLPFRADVRMFGKGLILWK